jgi:hypothetical protein
VADSELIVRLRGENSDLKAKLAEVTNASKTSANSMSSVFTGALGKIGSAIGVTFSVAAVLNFAKQSVMAFAETERAAASLSNVISNMGGSEGQAKGVLAIVDGLEKMSGFDDAEIMRAFQELSVQTGSGAKASEALGVAMDIAAARGITLKEAGQQVFQVMSGLSRSMRQFGMETREGATDMDYLRELGGKMSGSLSTNLDTLDGKFRLVTNSVDRLKEAIGNKLKGAVSDMAGWLPTMLGGVADAMNIDEALKDVFGNTKAVSMVEVLGTQYGVAFLKGYINTLQGNDNWMDVGMKGNMTYPTGFGDSAPKVIGEDATATASAIKNAFKSAWEPISLMGGNLPELTKYIGNLRQASDIKQKVTVDVQMTVIGGSVTVKNASPVANAIAQVIVPAVQAAVTHGAGWTPGRFPGGGSTRFATQD